MKLLKEIQRKETPSGQGQFDAHEKVSTATIDLAKLVFGFEDRHIRALRAYGFAEIAADFARACRRFDPHLSDQDIFQASRNVWSMNFMQVMLGRPTELTPAIFAYSLLYPYTDNYLDDPQVSPEAKLLFNRRFSRRLAGETVRPINVQEQIISDLIGMIEDQYERARYPDVYESLKAIHQAQSKSIHLLKRQPSPYLVDVLGICFEKGGTSVLADGYLVNGSLTEAQQEFMFFYGVLTQLVDDLEDIQQDLQDGLMTVFSHTAGHWPLDQITNRTFHFSYKFLEAMDQQDAPEAEPLKEIIRKSLDPILILELGSVSRYFTRPYLRSMQKHSPFRFAFLRKQRKILSDHKVSLMSLVEALVVPASGSLPRG